MISIMPTTLSFVNKETGFRILITDAYQPASKFHNTTANFRVIFNSSASEKRFRLLMTTHKKTTQQKIAIQFVFSFPFVSLKCKFRYFRRENAFFLFASSRKRVWAFKFQDCVHSCVACCYWHVSKIIRPRWSFETLCGRRSGKRDRDRKWKRRVHIVVDHVITCLLRTEQLKWLFRKLRKTNRRMFREKKEIKSFIFGESLIRMCVCVVYLRVSYYAYVRRRHHHHFIVLFSMSALFFFYCFFIIICIVLSVDLISIYTCTASEFISFIDLRSAACSIALLYHCLYWEACVQAHSRMTWYQAARQ